MWHLESARCWAAGFHFYPNMKHRGAAAGAECLMGNGCLREERVKQPCPTVLIDQILLMVYG